MVPIFAQQICFGNCQEAFQKVKSKNPMTKMMAAGRLLKGMQGKCELPEFSGTTLTGDTLSKEMLKGKVAVFNFWFTTCPPCIGELPGLNRLVEEFGGEEVVFIAVGRDPEPEIQRFLEQRTFKYHHLSDATAGELLGQFCILGGFPTNMVFDKDGILKHISMGGSPSENQEKYHELKPVIKRSLKK